MYILGGVMGCVPAGHGPGGGGSRGQAERAGASPKEKAGNTSMFAKEIAGDRPAA
jgi:hypothetical protein